MKQLGTFCFAAGLFWSPFEAIAAERDAAAVFLRPLAVAPTTSAQVDQRCAKAATLAKQLRTALEGRTGPGTMRGDFTAFDTLVNLLESVGFEAYLVGAANPSADLRTSGQACERQMTAAVQDIWLSQPIYTRLTAIPPRAVDASSRYLLDRVLLRFRQEGVERPDSERQEIGHLRDAISRSSAEFSRNIAEDKRTISFMIGDLAGVPTEFVQAHTKPSSDIVTLSVQPADLGPVMTYATSADTRRRAYDAFMNLAWSANDAVLAALLKQRNVLAHLLGQQSYAALDLRDKMAGSPEHAWALLNDVRQDAGPAALSDAALLGAPSGEAGKIIDPASLGYLNRLVRKERFGADSADVRRYFTLDRTRDGIFALMRRLFGAEIRPATLPVWSKDVTAWSLYDGKRLVGQFYLDLSPRAGKFNLARAFVLRTGKAGSQLPVAGLLANFPADGPIEHAQVVTFLHEFGHLIHMLYGGTQRYALASPWYIEKDFLEAPSQMLEEWAWDYDTLRTFARTPEGQQIPAALVARMNAARKFGLGLEWSRNLSYSAVALGFHGDPPPGDLKTTYDALVDRYSPIPEGANAHRYDAFVHLTLYGASYYGYVWSKAIAYDLIGKFKAAGLYDRATGRAYRDKILMAGSAKPAAAMVRDFLGRDWSTKAFRADLRSATQNGPPPR